jgi:hypothetical protein
MFDSRKLDMIFQPYYGVEAAEKGKKEGPHVTVRPCI